MELDMMSLISFYLLLFIFILVFAMDTFDFLFVFMSLDVLIRAVQTSDQETYFL